MTDAECVLCQASPPPDALARGRYDALSTQILRGRTVEERRPDGVLVQRSHDHPALPDDQMQKVAQRIADALADR